jgi:HEAT repeat protein
MVLMLSCLLAVASPTDEAWVRSWMAGAKVAPNVMKGFHHLFDVSSPHASDTFRYEAAQRTLAISQDAAARDRLAAVALTLLLGQRTAPEARARAARVLGWLRSPTTVEPLIAASSAGAPVLREDVVEALGRYGTAPSWETAIVFGGNLARLEFPAAPDPRATHALVLATHDAEPLVRQRAFAALDSHQGDEVHGALLDAVREQRESEQVVPSIVRRRLLEAQPLVLALASAADAQTRALAATALGVLGVLEGSDPRPRLLALLDDPSDEVFLGAHRALRALAGYPGETPGEATQERALLTGLWKRRGAH